MSRTIRIADFQVGPGHPLLVIAGPCVIEDRDEMLSTAETLAKLMRRVGVSYVFKSSFLKDNRTSIDSHVGPGLDEGLDVLLTIKREIGCPILTDVHQSDEVTLLDEAGIDVLQIPAFLSRQTRLLRAAGESRAAVNVKKGQFLAPEDLVHVAGKLDSVGCDRYMFTERGTSFGYHDLVVDFRGFALAHEHGWPWIFDVTHSLQRPAAHGHETGGTPQLAPMMARAAVAAGVQGLFMEAHPEPRRAHSDASTQLPLDSIESWLPRVVDLHRQLQEG